MATNASALIVVASPGLPPIDMNCEGAAQCNNVNVGLPATMVSATAGQTLYDAINATAATGSAAYVTFTTAVSRGRNAGISAAGDWIQIWGGSGAGASSPALDLAADCIPIAYRLHADCMLIASLIRRD